MYLKKLELIGFKSFSDKTTLHFEPGITAVVGPNGCGKSNIFDSLRWVLGEQSVKSLRGSDMQDVIFNGTDNKEPLSMAEVSVSFDNSAGFFNVQDNEVLITRRLFRSGESEYLLNKTQVRLKDIMDILMGTGIGAESYSLVAQGKIDLVLSSRPEDRRLVFDEAAGITKYKSQKRETMRRLEDTDMNLLRVNDIVTEVKRQIGSLERQANKARKYKEVFEELKTRELEAAIISKKELASQKEEIGLQLAQLSSQESELAAIMREQETKINNRQQELEALETQIMSARQEVSALDNQLIRNNERIGFDKEKIEEIESLKKQLSLQLEQTRQRLVMDEEKLNKVKGEYEQIQAQLSEKQELQKQKEGQLLDVTASIKKALENISTAKKDIMDFIVRSTGVNNDIQDCSSRQHINIARQKRLEIEKVKVNEEKTRIGAELDDINTQVESVQKCYEELNSKVTLSSQELEKENLSLENLRQEIESRERQLLTLQSQKEFVLKLKTKYDDISESMDAVIYLDRPIQTDLTGLVIKIKDASSLAPENNLEPNKTGFRLSGEAKPFELDTHNIDTKIEQAQEVILRLKNDKSSKESNLLTLKQALVSLQEELRSQELVLANKKANQSAVSGQFNKINDEAQLLELELEDLKKDIEQNQAKIDSLNALRVEVEQQKTAAEEKIVSEQSGINSNSTVKEELLVCIARVKAELESLHKRIDSDSVTLKIVEDSYNQDKASVESIDKQLKEGQSRKEALIVEIQQLSLENEDLQKASIEKKEVLKGIEKSHAQIAYGSAEAMKSMEEHRAKQDKIKNGLYNLQMQVKDIEFKYTSLKERMLQAYKLDLDAAEGQPEVLQERLPDELRAQIQELKQKLDSYGTVNLVAIEEYDELKQRYDFLIRQQNDLVNAKESLQEAIRKINHTTRKMFLETFEKVREEFRNYFRLLFNGGDAQLFLIDEQDVLESGIEIICRPPGKKLQNVLLLSGGEKTMSAIALIFAIFKVKPSPFCVLDEIDAALDEANVDRFSRMLQEFVKQSQFIVITHNKKTIANANVMYGITMEESGVSKIVSVKFSENKARLAQAKSEPETVAEAV